MKHIFNLLIIIILISACGQNSNIESSVKAYMKDSIVPRFNDPSSYQFVSMKIDTFTGKDYLNNLQRLYIDTDTSLLGSEIYNEKKNEIHHLSDLPGYKDSVLHLNIEVEYRGKNKMGALILDKTELRYFPKDDKITTVQ